MWCYCKSLLCKLGYCCKQSYVTVAEYIDGLSYWQSEMSWIRYKICCQTFFSFIASQIIMIFSGIARILMRRHGWSGISRVYGAWDMLMCFLPSPPLISGVQRYDSLKILWSYICMQVSFIKFLIQKSAPWKLKWVCLETLVSSHPVNAGCTFIEMSQIEIKYDYDVIRDNSELSPFEFWDPFWRFFGAGTWGKCPPPSHYDSAWVHDDEFIQQWKTYNIFLINCRNNGFKFFATAGCNMYSK